MTGSKIEWTGRSDWNPIRGCTRVSNGCGGPGDQGGCYAEGMAARFSKPGQWGHGFAEMKSGKPRWTGHVALQEDRLTLPLQWRTPAKIFVSSTSDLFHEKLDDMAIYAVFAAMAMTFDSCARNVHNVATDYRQRHVYQVLTKRPDRMQRFVSALHEAAKDLSGATTVEHPFARASAAVSKMAGHPYWMNAPLVTWLWVSAGCPGLWLGSSCEDQPTADERIPHLLATPAAVRFLSCEPLLGPIDFENVAEGYALSGRQKVRVPKHAPRFAPWKEDEQLGDYLKRIGGSIEAVHGRIDWVISGGESGPHARPMHPDWARSLRDQCAATGTAFFHKQNGEFAPGEIAGNFLDPEKAVKGKNWNGIAWVDAWSEVDGHVDDEPDVYRVGKKNAGRLLDGVEHSAFPSVHPL